MRDSILDFIENGFFVLIFLVDLLVLVLTFPLWLALHLLYLISREDPYS